MDRILRDWERCCATHRILRFVDINLRGAGQVLFQDNPLSGALFLVALGWGALAAGTVHVMTGGIAALVAGTATAYCLRADAASLRTGLYGYNGLLAGLALTYVLGRGVEVLGYAVLAGAVTAIAMLGPLNAASCAATGESTKPRTTLVMMESGTVAI